MKKGYKRLLFFIVLLILVLLVNSFLINIFSPYKMILFLLFLLLIFHLFFVIEKDNHRYLNDVIFEVFIYSISFFLLFYILGFIVGYVKTQNYYTLYGFTQFIIPTILYCILREFFRYNMLCKADGSKISTAFVIVLFILFDMTNSIYFASLKSGYEVLRFVALTILPTISRNLAYTYISKKMGYKPIIMFDLIFSLYPYLIPILPNPYEYLVSIINLLVPIIFAFRILKFFDRKEDHYLPSNYYKMKIKGAIIPTIIVLTLIYFYSGYFRFYVIAIGSGSMEPKIKKGDVVIVDRGCNKDSLKEGQVIAYKKDNVIVVHRIVKKMKLNNSYVYYTKGDTNDNIDDFLIQKDNIVGKVNHKIGFIGYPTVWLSER